MDGICIGEALALSLHMYLHQFCEEGDNPDWNWQSIQTGQPYNHYHFTLDWHDPALWKRGGFAR